ncbi:MAG: hypothetical protein WDN69_27995 [Aliidongia sp.]
MDTETQFEEIERLYRRAFAEFGAVALWSMRPVDHPTPDARRRAGNHIRPAHSRLHGGADGWPKISSVYAVPLSKLQSCLLRLLADRRSPESHVA